jgi:glycosyltransferase involved in cell wall biosynthesis
VYALKEKGYRFVLAHQGPTLEEKYGYRGKLFDKIIKLPAQKEAYEYIFLLRFRKVLNKIISEENIELIHSHNSPDFLTVAAIRYTELPVVHDTHDMISTMDKDTIKFNSIIYKTLQRVKLGRLMGGDDPARVMQKFEREANERSDARIYASPYWMELAMRKYNIDKRTSIVFYNYPLWKDIPSSIQPKLSEKDGEVHIVYEGSVSSAKKSVRYLLPLFEEIAKRKIHIHIYAVPMAGNVRHLVPYERTARDNRYMHFHGTQELEKLLAELSKYDFGLIPSPEHVDSLLLDTALPNKMFEYLSCGLPVISARLRSIEQFINLNKVGFVFDDTEELVAKLNTEKYTIKNRYKYTMEKNISKLINLYDKVMQ